MAELPFTALWRALAPDLPEPIPEYRFHPRRRWRFDWAFPAEHLAIEFDGGQRSPGGGRHNTDGDRLKLNTARALGWTVLQFSNRAWADDPAGCIELVQLALTHERPTLPPYQRQEESDGADQGHYGGAAGQPGQGAPQL